MKTYIFIILLLCLFSSGNAQGVVYSAEEADILYGSVVFSTDVQSILLVKYFNQTEGALMFRIQDGNLIILNNERVQLYPGTASVSGGDIFRVFSITLIDQIIQNGQHSSTVVELRNNWVISLTNGNYTLEFGQDCPPYCP